LKKEIIYAVHDQSLENFLESLGLLDKIKKEEIRCVKCDCTITLENLGFIIPSKAGIEICCDNPKCYYEMMQDKSKG
jgi:hypothetical protein